MAYSSKDHERALREAFPAKWDGERGMMALPITGSLLSATAPDKLAGKLKALLPADAKIVDIDGLVFRMKADTRLYGSDVFVVAFASAQWPDLPEGGNFPALTPLFMGEPQPDTKLPDMRAIGDLHPEMGCEMVVNKRTHSISFARESDDSVTIVVRPKQ